MVSLPPEYFLSSAFTQSGHGSCEEQINRWEFRDLYPNCDCSIDIDAIQTVNHILSGCPLQKFNGHIYALNKVSSEAIYWHRCLDIDVRWS